FHEGLLVLGIVVLGILRKVAEVPGSLDALGDLLALHGLEVIQLAFQLRQAFRRKQHLVRHSHPLLVLRRRGGRRRRSAPARRAAQAAYPICRRSRPGEAACRFSWARRLTASISWSVRPRSKLRRPATLKPCLRARALISSMRSTVRSRPSV